MRITDLIDIIYRIYISDINLSRDFLHINHRLKCSNVLTKHHSIFIRSQIFAKCILHGVFFRQWKFLYVSSQW